MEQVPLLQTKLHIPPMRSELVSRPRLVQRLDQGLRKGHRLALVSAPAGFGKTTLVSEWVRHHRDAVTAPKHASQVEPLRFAWLSLDQSDSDPARFLVYLIAALRAMEPQNDAASSLGRAFWAALQAPQPPPVEAVLTSLINGIAALPGRIALILDDYHLIDDPAIHQALDLVLERPPAQMHLVIATREDPPLALARLRARGQLAELRAADLRFTSAEAADFFNRVVGLELSTEAVKALGDRTEGWIAGLQLAALALQGSVSRATTPDQRQEASGDLIRSFAGSHRFVLDYLIQEVLDQQAEDLQAFLLRTSVLRRLTGSLCETVTGQAGGQTTLEMLERANLFIVPLDEERAWYRYHHLFGELLRQRLEITQPGLAPTLHHEAACWHEAYGSLSEAIHHALAAEDVETATRLIEQGALHAMERSDLRFILNSVERLPEPALREAPWLFVYHAWTLLLTGQVEAAASRLDDTSWLLDAAAEEGSGRRKEMLGHIAGLQALLCLWRQDLENGTKFSNEALANLPGDSWIRGYCAMVVGAALWSRGDLAASKEAYEESARAGRASGHTLLEVSGACNVARALELEGHLQQALELFQDIYQRVQRDGQILPVAGYVLVDTSRVLYELNELELAGRYLEQGIELCQLMADGRAEKIGYCLLARAQVARGDLAGAAHSIRRAKEGYPVPSTGVDLRGGDYPQVWLWLRENNLAELRTWLDGSRQDFDQVANLRAALTHTMFARALIALGREAPGGVYLEEARVLLAKLLDLAERSAWGGKLIEILVLQSMAQQAGGDLARAGGKLARALTLAEPEGFVRTFVDEGAPLALLLRQVAARGPLSTYAKRLLEAFSDEQLSPAPSSIPRQSSLVEPLSQRELEVLQLISLGLTNQQIAARLFVSLHTVKSHTRNIYGKLGVHSRTQALARAHELELLQH